MKMFYSLFTSQIDTKQNIICVSKFDEIFYNEFDFDNIKTHIANNLRETGISLENMKIIPTSVLKQYNISKLSLELNWFKGPSLVEALKNITPQNRNYERPLRIIIYKIFMIHGLIQVLGGRIVSGMLRIGQRVIFAPSGYSGYVESIEIFKRKVKDAYDGDIIGFTVSNIYSLKVKKGYLVSDVYNEPVRECECFSAEIFIIDHPTKIYAGYTPALNINTSCIPCTFKVLQRTFDRKTGALLEEQPEFLKNGDSAIVVMVPAKPLCLETFADYPKLGRFIVSDLGRVIAIGTVKEVLKG